MDYPGWTIETTHPVDEADPDFCDICANGVAPAVAFAADNGSTAYGSQLADPNGGYHLVVVRAV